MQYKTFTIPAAGCEKTEEQLNLFLKTNKIISISKQFVAGETLCWCFLVEYVEADGNKPHGSSKKIDYMQILTREEFAVFSKLRECRKKLAETEKIPAYSVLTDAQLYSIIKANPESVDNLKRIDGLGPAKCEKYGSQIMEVILSFSTNEQNPGASVDEENKIPF